MQYRTNRGQNINAKERMLEIISFLTISILILITISFLITAYIHEKNCKAYIKTTINSVFQISSEEYTIIESICDTNNAISKNNIMDARIKTINNSLIHIVDKLEKCNNNECDHTLCISSNKRDNYFIKFTDYVCANRVLSNGSPIKQELENQRRECHIFFDMQKENKTIFSAFFPRGVGVIKLEKGTLDC